MANAKKCDRCGAFYENNTLLKSRLCGNRVIVGIRLVTNAGSVEEEYDLCDHCLTELSCFLHGYNNEELK